MHGSPVCACPAGWIQTHLRPGAACSFGGSFIGGKGTLTFSLARHLLGTKIRQIPGISPPAPSTLRQSGPAESDPDHTAAD